MLSIEENFPEEYRLATVDDVRELEDEARAAVQQEVWGIVKLKDGKIDGPGYGCNVESGSFTDFTHKLVVTGNHGYFFAFPRLNKIVK